MVGTRRAKFGTFLVEFNTPGIGQIMKAAGCDYVLLDMEHSGFSFDTLKSMLRYMQAAELATIVRVPSRNYHHIARSLDMGVEGLMLPMVGSAEEAAEIVAHAKYLGQGHRGVALQVVHDRYQPGPVLKKLRDANKRSTVFCQIKTSEGAPLKLYEKPVNKFVAGFLGSPAMKFIPATAESDGGGAYFRMTGELRLPIPAGRAGTLEAAAKGEVLLGIRPEHMHRRREGADQAGFGPLPVRIEIVEPMGANTLINFHIGESSVLARLSTYADQQPGEDLTLLVDMNRTVVVDPESEAVIS